MRVANHREHDRAYNDIPLTQSWEPPTHSSAARLSAMHTNTSKKPHNPGISAACARASRSYANMYNVCQEASVKRRACLALRLSPLLTHLFVAVSNTRSSSAPNRVWGSQRQLRLPSQCISRRLSPESVPTKGLLALSDAESGDKRRNLHTLPI